MSVETGIVEDLKSKFTDAITDASVQRQARIILTAKSEAVINVASYLKENLGFDFVVSVCGAEMPQEDLFTIIYHFWSSSKKILITLKTKVPKKAPKIQSITPVYESANWHERETHEMWGVKFIKHPDLGGLLLPEGWKDLPPQRKEFKLTG